MKKYIAKFKNELAVYRLVLEDPKTPTLGKVFLGLALGYLLLPFDLIPDFIPILGQVDDIIIVPLFVYLALLTIPQELIEEKRRIVRKRK